MTDEDFFAAPGRKVPPRQPVPGELLWTVRRDAVMWSCELRTYNGLGVEAQILRDGELVIGRTWPTRPLAIAWAEQERKDLEK